MVNSPRTWTRNIDDILASLTALRPSGCSGQLYFVNPNQTADIANGLSVDNAKQWTNSGVVLCGDGNGDLIIRLPGNENIDDDDVDPPIVIDKKAVIILGTGGGNPNQQGEVNCSIRRRQNAAWGAAAGPAIDVQSPCSIIGVEVVAVAQNAILFSGEGGGENGAFSLVYRCRFVGWALMLEAIHFDAGTYNKILESRFESLPVGIMLGSTLGNNPDYNEIINNIFQGCTFPIDTVAGATPHNTLVRGNTFIPSNTAAMTNAIRTLGAWDSGEISHNNFGCTRAQAYDVGVAALRAAGVLVYGNTYTDGTDEELDYSGLTTFEQRAAAGVAANGVTPVVLYDGLVITNLTKICGFMCTRTGVAWAGVQVIWIEDGDGNKIFPFQANLTEGVDFADGVQVTFNFLVEVPVSSGYRVMFQSTAAGDNAGQTLDLDNLDVIEVG